MMRGIRRHYDAVRQELAAESGDRIMPSRIHGVVLVSSVHKPTLRALAFARASRPDTLTALTVNVDDTDTRAEQHQLHEQNIPVSLTVIDSPYREITRPIVEYVKALRRNNPRELVAVYIPEYVVGHWWENLLHNQSALRLKGRLLFESGVMIINVPWWLRSTAGRDLDRAAPSPGDVRRGVASTREPDRIP